MASFRPLATSLSVWMILAGTAYAESTEGPPQMDLTWFPNQILWLAISFGVLYLLVSKSIAPTVGGVLQARDEAITLAIGEAEAAKREAESIRGNFESAGQSARVKSAEMVASAQAKSSREAADALTKLDNDLARKANQADAVVADAVAKAQASMESATASLAAVMAGKLLGGTVAENTAAAAVQTVKKAS